MNIAVLQRHANSDFADATRYPLPTHKMRVWLGLGPDADITFDMFSYLSRTGNGLRVFEELLQDVGAPAEPFVCVTSIVDGEPRTDLLTHIDPLSVQGAMIASEFESTIHKTDFLANYLSDGRLAIDSLLEDDFLAAIKLLHRRKHYVSAVKLLVSFVDTLAFLEYGDTQGNFIKWVKTYADIESVGVTPSELWEFRNAVLHMTTPHSRKVLDGKHPALCFYSDSKQRRAIADEVKGEKIFSFEALYESILGGIDSWTTTYSGDLQKQIQFTENTGHFFGNFRAGEFGFFFLNQALHATAWQSRMFPFIVGEKHLYGYYQTAPLSVVEIVILRVEDTH